MSLEVCKQYLSYSMVLNILILLCNHDNLILKLQKKIATLMKGSFKIGSVPGMINKEVLAQAIYK